MDEYDYIVVGGGSACAIVARRFSQNPSTRVALIEAGLSSNAFFDRAVRKAGNTFVQANQSLAIGNSTTVKRLW